MLIEILWEKYSEIHFERNRDLKAIFTAITPPSEGKLIENGEGESAYYFR